MMKLARIIAANFEFDKVILEFHILGQPNSGWVHVSFNTAGNKKEELTAVKQNGKTIYLKGIVT